MPGDSTPQESPPGDGGQPADYSPPPDSAPGNDYTPPGDGLPGDYDGGNPAYNPDGTMGPPHPPRVKTLLERAIDAFRAGNESEGFNLLRTHLAVSPGADADLATKMAWIPVLRRPGIGARIGIAAHYVTPVGDFADSPQPIGSAQLKQALAAVASSARGGQGGNAGEVSDATAGINYGNDPTQAGDGTKAAEAQLEFYTGDFGTKLLAALKAKMESGEYGLTFKDLAEEVARPAPMLDPNNPGYDPNNPGYAGDTTASGLTPPGDGYVDPGTGQPAGQAAAGPSRLAIAVTWLGKIDKREDLAKRVQDAGVDVLVTYEISLKATRVGNLINNQTRVKITDAKKGDNIFTSPVLENRAVMQARDKGSEEDPVDKQIVRAIEALDKVCKPTELPAAVNAERVKTRIAGLIAEKPTDPLPVLVEMRFYTAKGLLTAAEMHAAAVSLMGEAEYAQLIASSPTGDLNDYIGGAISLPGMLELMRGVNGATGASARAEARKRQAAASGAEGGTKARGWFDLLGGKKK